ncbi:MAG: hypothetical protein QXS29_10565 [Nitrososphaeria archaeon]
MPIYYQVNTREITTAINIDTFPEVGIFNLTVMPMGTVPSYVPLTLPMLFINIQNYQELSFKNHTYRRSKVGGVWNSWERKSDYNIPVGSIIMNGNLAFISLFSSIDSVVDGFMLCMGGTVPTNIGSPMGGQTVPDLRDRFILGITNTGQLLNTGGNHFITLNENQLPWHNHGISSVPVSGNVSVSLNTNSSGEHDHRYSLYYAGTNITNIQSVAYHVVYGSGRAFRYYTYTTATGGTHSHSINGNGTASGLYANGNTGGTGGGQSIDIRPNFIKLAFLIKVV